MAAAGLWRLAALAAVLGLPGAASFAQAPPAPDTVAVPAGPYIAGSDRAEREAAYRMDEAAYRHSITRKNRWYEDEAARGNKMTAAYAITCRG